MVMDCCGSGKIRDEEAARLGRAVLTLAPPVSPRSISMSQSSTSSLSDSESRECRGPSSGRSKSASGHSSVIGGAGMRFIGCKKERQRDYESLLA